VRAVEIAERLRGRFADVLVARDEVTVVVDRDDLHDVLTSLRGDEELALDFLSCVTATDWPERSPRYWVSYELYSMAHKHRLRLKVGLPEDDPRVPSVTPLYPTADWLERETFDLYGIVFEGHPRLARIMLPDGWEGHPLRKTEELGGVNTRFKGAFVPPVDRRKT
jgi:NADH-quinone oxidoreductase subunit C